MNPRIEAVLAGHGGIVTSLAFTDDGNTLVSGGYDRTVIVWDVRSMSMRHRFTSPDYINDVAITPNGNVVVADDGQVWDATTGQRMRRSFGVLAPLAVSPTGEVFACCTFPRSSHVAHVRLTDIRTGRIIHTFECGEMQAHSLAFSADGDVVGATCFDSRVGTDEPYVTTVYNLSTRDVHRVLLGRKVGLFGSRLGSSANIVAISTDGLHLWNARSGELIMSRNPLGALRGDSAEIVDISADGRMLVECTRGGDVSIVSVSAAPLRLIAQAHVGWVRDAALTHDSSALATCGDDCSVQLWDCKTGTHNGSLGLPRLAVRAVSFDDDGRFVSALSADGSACLWSSRPPGLARFAQSVWRTPLPSAPDIARNIWGLGETMRLLVSVYGDSVSIRALSPDGSLVALRLADGRVVVWSSIARVEQGALQHPEEIDDALAISQDNHIVAASCNGGGGRLLDTRSGEVLIELASTLHFSCFAFSADGRRVAAADVGRDIGVWCTQTGRRVRRLRAPTDGICTVALSRNANRIAFASAYDETVWLKRLTGGRRQGLVGHTGSICSVAFSEDGSKVASGAKDGTTRIWDVDKSTLDATFVHLIDGNWLVSLPNGEHVNSPDAHVYLA